MNPPFVLDRLKAEALKSSERQKVAAWGRVIFDDFPDLDIWACNRRILWPSRAKASVAEHFTIHAEMGVIAKAARRSNGRLDSLAVLRLTPGGKLGLARPCDECMRAIAQSGVEIVYWTSGKENRWEMMLL